MLLARKHLRGAPIRVVFLDDRIEVESMGILVPGLTIDDMKQGTSRIRNHVITRVFQELHLIEQWGTGVRRIFEEAKELGLPEPKIEEIGMRLRFTVYLRQEQRLLRLMIQSQSQGYSQKWLNVSCPYLRNSPLPNLKLPLPWAKRNAPAI